MIIGDCACPVSSVSGYILTRRVIAPFVEKKTQKTKKNQNTIKPRVREKRERERWIRINKNT